MGFNIHFLLVKDDDWEQYSPDEQLVYNSFLDNKFNIVCLQIVSP